MDINFPLVLVLLTLGTGLVWLGDRILFFPTRKRAAIAANQNGGTQQHGAAEDLEIQEPALVEMCRSFFPVLAVVLVLRSFLVEPFQIPSGSMLPTLEVGDFILVNKFSYGIRLPVLNTKVVELSDPQRGDVMVFRTPVDKKTNYIKRVIGLPGDKIRYQNKMLYINNKPMSEEFIGELNRLEMYQEQLGEVKHNIYKAPSAPYNRNPRSPQNLGEGEWVVPEGSYFVMGDNRDNSNDSRFWGFVPDEMIVGKAFAIWMHWESLTSIPSFSRVGGIQ